MSTQETRKFTRSPIHGVTKEEALQKRLGAYRQSLIDSLKILMRKRKSEVNKAKVARIVAEVRRIAHEIGPIRH